ncbi:OsmC family protein [Rhodohalobacter sp. 8-1]|uniref:OsmC family protein n=1 Tax=Rhodohalobacter sp. 8-1 TaxID=3131972 RepID=UPI0030EF2381
MRLHHYSSQLQWTGNRGEGTVDYRSYDRSYTVSINGKADIQGSADPVFRGDHSKWNPEELFLASLSACHMLWYLHLCSDAGIRVKSYEDPATGIMEDREDGSGRFTEVKLYPHVTISDSDNLDKAKKLHQHAHERCFIANSCNFPVRHEAEIRFG